MIPNTSTSSQASSPARHSTPSSPYAPAYYVTDWPIGSSHAYAASNRNYVPLSLTLPTPQYALVAVTLTPLHAIMQNWDS